MNEYLVRTERSAWHERLVVEEIDGPARWRFHGFGDSGRGIVATSIWFVASIGFGSALTLTDQWSLAMVGIVAAALVAYVADLWLFSRYSLRDATGQTVVELSRRVRPFDHRFRMVGPGASDADVVIGRKRVAIELLGHAPIELRGSPSQGSFEFVQGDRVIGRSHTWSTDARDSLTLRVEPGPLEPFLVAVTALLDRTKRKPRPGDLPGG